MCDKNSYIEYDQDLPNTGIWLMQLTGAAPHPESVFLSPHVRYVGLEIHKKLVLLYDRVQQTVGR